MGQLFPKSVYVRSCGVFAGVRDPFVDSVMDEIGISMEAHHPKTYDDLQEGGFDLIITLTPEAHHMALELTRTQHVDIVYWPTLDPTLVFGSRTQILDSYRQVRDSLRKRIIDLMEPSP